MARRVKKEEEKLEAAAAASPTPQAPTSSREDPLYPLEVYLENCKPMFGKQRYVVVGALHGVTIPPEGITKSHMQALIDRFLTKPLS